MMQYIVSAFYQFTRLDHLPVLQQNIRTIMDESQIYGTILIAPEGINGTVSANRAATDRLFAYLRDCENFINLQTKESFYQKPPFYRSRVRIKKEIVTMGVGDLDPAQHAGIYIEPDKWDAFIGGDDVILVDTRNDYEVAIGTFKNAINPKTKSFREFPEFTKNHLTQYKDKKIAMFCTGGIRCEKSTSYLKSQGFQNVYHLQGGILKYIENMMQDDASDQDDVSWQGECFVFDQRVAVTKGLKKGAYDQCYACRMPITEQDKLSDYYIIGISCHHCHDTSTDARKKAWAQRQKQIGLSRMRGEQHIGVKFEKETAK